MSEYKFKVGDKVRLIKHIEDLPYVTPGMTGRILGRDGTTYEDQWHVSWDSDDPFYVREGEIELVESEDEVQTLAAEFGIDPEAAARAIDQFRSAETAEFSLDEPYALWELELLAGPEFVQSVGETLDTVKRTLLEKNISYGNSALDPVRVFSKASPTEQLRVRIDDKISRLQRGGEDTEDTVLDLIGYLILLQIAEGEG